MAERKRAERKVEHKIIFDGKAYSFESGMTVLQAAEAAGIYIPTLCSHQALPPFGACRLCIVEIEGMRGFPASCSTPAEDGMVVRTNTDEVMHLRRAVLELILSEHPTGCLFCERKVGCEDFRGPGHLTKAGTVTGCMLCPNKEECELRILVEKIGISEVRLDSSFRSLPLERLDPFFDRDYNLCVLCGRCVRVCQEIRGTSILEFINRGPETRIGTSFHHLHLDMGCQFCGACVDVCPTGALADRTSKWEPPPQKTVETTCTLCTVGCSIEVAASRDRVVRTTPSRTDGINSEQLCVLGRFGIAELVNSRDRVTTPLTRKVGQLVRTSWEDAITLAAEGLSGFKSSETALLYPGLLTDEEANACRAFARTVLRTENYPYRFPPRKWNSVNASLSGLGIGDCILLVGADLTQTHPILGHNIKRAVDRGAKLLIIDTVPTFLDKFAAAKIRALPGDFSWALAGLIWAVVEKDAVADEQELAKFKELPKWAFKLLFEEIITHIGTDERTLNRAADILLEGSSTLVIVGREVGVENTHTHFNGLLSDFKSLMSSKTKSCEVNFARSTRDFDAHWLKVMQNIESMRVRALVMIGDLVPRLSPEWPNPLQDLDFLVVIDSHNGTYTPYAEVVLPAAAFTEKGGTFTAVDGTVHKLHPAVRPMGQSKPECEILALLAKAMGRNGDGLELPRRADRDTDILPRPERDFALSEQPSAPNLSREEVKCSNEWPLMLVNRHNSYLLHGHRLSRLVGGILSLCMSDFVRLSPSTAKNLDIRDGDEVYLVSGKGRGKLKAKVDCDIPTGLLVSRMTAKDPRLLALMGKEQASFWTNTAAVRIEKSGGDDNV
ncbi:MAG: molybdopterin-dependent oxidoreductase [Candidatus Coatesbacteria bacterium]|nr:molybdopterin-dependent oxidoreductase [Candidatus Coatesbacteria bacterium]